MNNFRNKQNVLYVILAVMLSSCATIYNKPGTNVRVHTSAPARIVLRNDTFQTSKNEVWLYTTRSKEALPLTIIGDKITKTVHVQSQNSFAYYLNICTPLVAPGFIIDGHKPIIYSYGYDIYINPTDSADKFYRDDPFGKKNELNFHLSIPLINIYSINPDDRVRDKGQGMGGIKAGIDYYHSRNQFVAINASYSGTILQAEQFFDTTRFPITTTRFYSASVSISNNYKIKRLLLGYGISYSKYTHYTYYTYGYNIEASKTYKSTNNVIGLVIPIYYQITNHFFVGLEYKPSIWRISSSNPVDYEHVINFEFGWKIF